jgi:lambda repressor-like predicted transcriptional regulator
LRQLPNVSDELSVTTTPIPDVDARADLAEQVRTAIRGVPISVRALARELGLSHEYLREVLDKTRTPTELRARRILEQIAALHAFHGTAPKTKSKGGARS